MTDDASEYGRLLAERDRLIEDGADPAELEVPLRPRRPMTRLDWFEDTTGLAEELQARDPGKFPPPEDPMTREDKVRAAARDLVRMWFDGNGVGSQSYAAMVTGKDPDGPFTQAMWDLRAALAASPDPMTPEDPVREQTWTNEQVIAALGSEVLRRDDPVPLLTFIDLLAAPPADGAGVDAEEDADKT